MREQFLCQQVPPPPPGVDTNLPPVERIQTSHQSRTAGGAHYEPDVRRLPQPDRSDRLRIRKIRRHRNAAGKAQAAVLSRRPAAWRRGAQSPRKIELGTGYQGFGRRICRIRSSPARESRRDAWPRHRSVRSALSSRFSVTWPAGRIRRPTPGASTGVGRHFASPGYRFKELMVYLGQLEGHAFQITERYVDVASHH